MASVLKWALVGLSAGFVVLIYGTVLVFLAFDRTSHSASDTLYGVFPYFACTFLLLNWLASNTSRPAGGKARAMRESNPCGEEPKLQS